MNILAAIKIVPDAQDITVTSDGALDFSKAREVVSEYDLNALEAAAQLSAATGGTAVAVTVGPQAIDDSKLKKNVLARGIDELYMVADDALADLDARGTAQALKQLVDQIGAYDVVVCGDGSADLYAKQTGAQLAAQLDVPYVAAALAIDAEGDHLKVRRMLENEVEVLEVPLPAVVSVLPDGYTPRICGMKDILAAGKKPMNVSGADGAPEAALEVVSCVAPEQADRKLEIMNAGDDGAIEAFAAALKAAL